jgi:hypothetical protein
MHFHVCQSVSGALRNWTKKDWEMVGNDNGMHPDAVKERFRILEFKGVKVVPIGPRCEGFSDQNGCPGHPEYDAPAALPEDGVA